MPEKENIKSLDENGCDQSSDSIGSEMSSSFHLNKSIIPEVSIEN